MYFIPVVVVVVVASISYSKWIVAHDMILMSLLRVNFHANMIAECPSFKFLSTFGRLQGIIIVILSPKKEIRKSMNFKQHSEREIKSRERKGKGSVTVI